MLGTGEIMMSYRATKEAIARAIRGEPKAAEVIEKRNLVKHPFAA
jgi:5,6,7,8-tetrahydromethanopterin hydro-lyase